MTTLVLPGYTRPMKTAISVPDATFARVDAKAAELGISRSQFYAVAAERYLGDLDADDITERLNGAIARAGEAVKREAEEFGAWSLMHLAQNSDGDAW